MADNRGLLRSKDAAHMLDCSPDSIVVLANKGKLRGVKEGSRWKFRFKDVEAYKKQSERNKD